MTACEKQQENSKLENTKPKITDDAATDKLSTVALQCHARISAEFLFDTEVNTIVDAIADQAIINITASVTGTQDVVNMPMEFKDVAVIETPANWFEHLKQSVGLKCRTIPTKVPQTIIYTSVNNVKLFPNVTTLKEASEVVNS